MISDKPVAPLADGEPQRKPGEQIGQQLNFYRVHTLFFAFTPLCLSVIFYACNGRYKISYIDSLFTCLSAMTVCGLSTINLSSLTGFQQALLFIQICIGNPVSVAQNIFPSPYVTSSSIFGLAQIIISWVMVVIRKSFFAQKLEHVLRNAAVGGPGEAVVETKSWPKRIGFVFSRRRGQPTNEENLSVHRKGTCLPLRPRKLRPDMVRRLDNEPKPVNPSGWVPEEGLPPAPEVNSLGEVSRQRTTHSSAVDTPVCSSFVSETGAKQRRPLSEPLSPSEAGPQHFETISDELTYSQRLPRTQTIEFAPMPEVQRSHVNGPHERRESVPSQLGSLRMRRSSSGPRMQPNLHDFGTNNKNRGFGGFPLPWDVIQALFSRLFPAKLKAKLGRTMTIPATITPSQGNARPGTKQVPYITFETIVGRNSAFHRLTREERDELGGIEYRALNALLWILPIYHISCQLLSFIVVAPYISQPRWQPIFRNEQQRPVNSVWFSAFQVVSAYTNTGMSLVDQSMIPFQEAILMVIVMVFLILAGNTCLPVFLRFTIWCGTKVLKRRSRLKETLHFLLDHPRRCYIYLFPSHQTLFLLVIVLSLNFVDWFFLLILNIGNPTIQQIPLGARVLDGLMQAVSVKAAGFAIFPLAALVPAVKVLFVVMMYISAYPIAMSVRSTNVYEEQSLGIFHEEKSNGKPIVDPESAPRLSVLSQHVVMHVQKQLAFDMWWLALSLFLVCIIEKKKLEDPLNCSWFNIFNIIFELVSAYGNVGLTLGIPDQHYSLVGAMRPLSKLVFCVVIFRGRHRGLPLAIDRAIMLPSELERAEAAFCSDDIVSDSEPAVSQTLNRFDTSRSSRTV